MAGSVQRYFAGLSRNTFLSLPQACSPTSRQRCSIPCCNRSFLTQTLKASGSIVGLIDGFAQAAQNIVQGFSGALSDKLQRRKPIAIFGYLLAAIAKPLMGLATVWPALFGARLLDRVGAGTRSAPRDALIASSVDEENRGRAFGLRGYRRQCRRFSRAALGRVSALCRSCRYPHDLLPGGHSRPTRVLDGPVRQGTACASPQNRK